MSTFKSVRIDSIEPNRNRNFKLYPVVKEQVKALAESFAQTGDFGVLPVRPLEGGGYEMAAGHHRLAAWKKAGETHVDVKIDYHTDDQMARIMMLENSRQMGNNAPAALDSLSTATYFAAYYLLISDTVEEFVDLNNNVGAQTILNKKGFLTAKTKIGNGDAVPFPYLKAYAGDGIAGESQVKDLSHTLQDSGELGRIYKRVQKRVDEELAAQEAEEQAAEKARVKAEKLAEKERLEAEAAAKAARAAAKKAKASQKKAAEARAKDMERLAKQKAKLRAEEAKRREAARQKADVDREERGRLKAEAKSAAKSAAEAEKGLNPDVLHMLKAQRHQEAFRKIVTGDIGKRVFPMGEQVAAVRDMIKSLEDDGQEMTTATIREYLNGIIQQKDDTLRRLIAERNASDAKKSTARKVLAGIAAFKGSAGSTVVALMGLIKIMDDEELGTFALREMASDQRLSDLIDAMEKMIVRLRASVKLRQSHYQASTIDHNADLGKIVSNQ